MVIFILRLKDYLKFADFLLSIEVPVYSDPDRSTKFHILGKAGSAMFKSRAQGPWRRLDH